VLARMPAGRLWCNASVSAACPAADPGV